MYDRILLATDFSDCSQAARREACELVDRFNAELHLLHVLPDPLLLAAEPGFAMPVPQEYVLQLEVDGRRALEGVLAPEWQARHKVVRQLRHGNPANEIVRYADEQRMALIVLGTHGRGALGHLFLGSVAERVVRMAGCPVLTVGPRVISTPPAEVGAVVAATTPASTPAVPAPGAAAGAKPAERERRAVTAK